MSLYDKWGVFIENYPMLAPVIFVTVVVICHELYALGGKYARKLRKLSIRKTR